MKVGDRVRVRDGVYSLYSWSKVFDHAGEVGTVVTVTGNDVIVKVTDVSQSAHWEKASWVGEIWSYPITALELLTPCQEEYVPAKTTGLDPVSKTKEKHMVYRVTAVLTPSAKAQENGAIESVLVDNEATVANDAYGAALVAGAKNSEAITKAAGGTIRVKVDGGF